MRLLPGIMYEHIRGEYTQRGPYLQFIRQGCEVSPQFGMRVEQVPTFDGSGEGYGQTCAVDAFALEGVNKLQTFETLY